MAELFGTSLVDVPHGTPLVFSHRACPGPLRVYGANAIQWAYQLITRSQQTYGGEVVQILGAYVAPMQIVGNTRSKTEYEAIRRWFLTYMTAAGLDRRDQEPILFTYAERGWSFNIQVTELPWSIAMDSIADEWGITAEIVADNTSNPLATVSMSPYTLPSDFINEFGDIGFTPATESTFDGATLGENFNRLLASWVTGEYDTFGFQSSADPTFNFESETGDFYTNAFGTEYIVPPADTGGSGITYDGGEPSTKLQYVALIASVFEAAGIPPVLGVAISYVETGGAIDPDARQPNGDYAVGLFQTFPAGAGGGQSHVRELRLAHQDREGKVTDHYPASAQIQDAAGWIGAAKNGRDAKESDTQTLANWAQDAQRAGVAYNSGYGLEKFTKGVKEARKLLAAAKKAGANSGTATGVRAKIVEYAYKGIEQAPTTYSQGGSRLQIPEEKGKMWQTDCSGWCTALYYWATDGDQKFNPNGPNQAWRGGGYTGTMFRSSNGKTVSAKDIQPGDLIIYGPGGANHVNVYLGGGKMAGFGRSGGPFLYDFPSGNSGWSGPVTYRSFLP